MIRRVNRGERFRVRASDWNNIASAAEHVEASRRREGFELNPARLGQTLIYVHNAGESDWDQWDAIALQQPRIPHADNAYGFFNQPAVIGSLVDGATGSRFGLLLEPIRAGYVGRAVLIGLAFHEIEIANEADQFASPILGQRRMRSAAAGPVSIIARCPTVSGKAWSIVRLGGGGGAGVGLSYAMISARIGSSPPYRYTAAGATMDVNGAWTGGGVSFENVFNLEEQGTGGQWVNGLNVGDVVTISPAPGGAAAYVCQRAHYRGTY